MKLTPKINKAFMFAARAHDGQIRRATGTPYFSHPAAIAFSLSEHTNDEDVIVAALLHDVIEDVKKEGYGAENIREEFGDKVLSIIQECTEPEKDGRDWYARKQEYIERTETCSEESLLVMLGDRLHNLQSLLIDFETKGPELWGVFYDGKKGRVWFFKQSLINFKKRLSVHPLLEAYERALADIRELPTS